MNDKMKLMTFGSAAALCFLLAALMPLLFMNRGSAKESLSEGERAAIFAAYWGGEQESVTAERIDQPAKRDVESCEKRLGEIVDKCTFDLVPGETQSSGSEYLTLTSGEDEMRICRIWRQRQGDWRNWLDVCFDMDTGELYYLYLSSECLKNQSAYADVLPAELSASFVADYIDGMGGYELINLDWTGSANDEATAIYTVGGSAVVMKISCIYYKSTLVDIKLTCA